MDFLDNLDISEEMKNYIEKLGFDEQKTSLFLLGVLIASIGSEQYNIAKKKVILEKINFGGMPIQKIKNFSTQIFEKLKQYKLLDYNEKIFAIAKELLDKNEKNWMLNPAENVYYILSGYAWKTKMILNKNNSEDKEG
jgi:CRISPR-associated protein Csh1